jgi:hypothetical protein
MKRTTICRLTVAAIIALCGNIAYGQNILDNDTLYIGNVSVSAGQHFELRVNLKTHHYFQGWTIPLSFGHGLSPVTCDSVSLAGTTMQQWTWTYKWTNNNNWGGVQTCGATGVYTWAGDTLPPGNYLALRLFFTVHDTAHPQVIRIDTTTCSFSPTGPMNSYIFVYHTQSWLTRVVAGSIVILPINVDENNAGHIVPAIGLYPTVARRGSSIRVRYESAENALEAISLFDPNGKMVAEYRQGNVTHADHGYDIPLDGNLASGVYFLVFRTNKEIINRKIIIR